MNEITKRAWRAIREGDGKTLRQCFERDDEIAPSIKNSGSAFKYVFLNSDGVEVLSVFKEHGFDLDLPDEDGCTPLWQAVFSGSVSAVEFLLKNGAIPDHEISRPLVRAVNHDDPDVSLTMIRLLVAAGADVNQLHEIEGQPGSSEFTALDMAEDPRVRALLESYGAKPGTEVAKK